LKSQYLYLVIVLLSILVPLAASFYSKAPFYKTWKFLSIAILLPGLAFIIWDEIFTQLKIWGFNSQYVTGVYIGSLPLEEILFFICIPYAGVFSYFILNFLIARDYIFPHHELLSFLLIVVLLISGIYNIDKAYTAVTFILLALYLAYLTLKVRPRYMGRFYVFFGVVLIPFFAVNGILTGSFIEGEVVWYNNDANLGFRIGTIPIEDIFYAMLLLLLNISVYEKLIQRWGYETTNP
jgi:lycopene cyclase domain-containing protein